jgi:3-oxoacid CoA-transferase B subunit
MTKPFEGLPREMIALRASRDIKEGSYVNLGIGIPTLISDWVLEKDIVLQSEIGMTKTGPIAYEEDIDPDLINASAQPVTELPGCAYFDIFESFNMIRGGYMDVVVMGAFQVNARGDYAGWYNPIRGLDLVGNVGGSMDLCAGAKKLFICMEHTSKNGDFKIVKELSYPATATRKVNMIFTDLAVMEIISEGILVKEIYPGLKPEDIQLVSEPKLIFSDGIKPIEL